MDVKKGKQVLLEPDFDAHPLWKCDEGDDLYYPIMAIEEFPEHNRDLLIRAIFHAPSGIIFKGYLVGAINIYCIGLFYNSSMFIFNKNAPDFCLKQFSKLAEEIQIDMNRKIMIPDIFPLKYETDIDLENYRNISGEFNAFEKIKDLRLLRWKID